MAEATRTKLFPPPCILSRFKKLAHAFDVEEEDLILQYHLPIPLAQSVLDLQKCTNVVARESAVPKLEKLA